MTDGIKLYCGDCAEVLKTIKTESVDLVVTSPPYDNLRTCYNSIFDLNTITNELMRVVKTGGVVVWIVSDATVNGSETGTSFRQALKFMDCGFKLNDTMIWKKPSGMGVGSLTRRYQNVFEYMFVLTKGNVKTFNPIKDKKNKSAGTIIHGTVRDANGKMRRMSCEGNVISDFGIRYNVWEIPQVKSAKERTGHPAQFPLQLAKDHIHSWSNVGDVVMDIFMGSGTTGVASVNMGRKFIGIELDKNYFEMAKKRIELAEQPLF